MKKAKNIKSNFPRVFPIILILFMSFTSLFITRMINRQKSQDTRSSAASAKVGEKCDKTGSECISTGTIQKKNGDDCKVSSGEKGKIKAGLCAGDLFIKCCNPISNSPKKADPDKECIDIGGKCQDDASIGGNCSVDEKKGIFVKGRCTGGSTRLCCVPECNNYSLTFYTSLGDENGGNTEMANGDSIKSAKDVVASNVYPFGTKIFLNSKDAKNKDIENFGKSTKTVKDRGGASFDNPCRLDVLIPRNSGESDNTYRNRVNDLGRPIVDGYIIND